MRPVISIDDIKKVRNTEPARILIYGPPGIGKTTLGSEFIDPIFIQTEDGAPSDIEISSFGIIDSYDNVNQIIRILYKEDHNYKTLVIDSITHLQSLIHTHVVNNENNSNIRTVEDFGYNKGTSKARKIWVELFNALNHLRHKKHMNIVFIGHPEIETFRDPMTEPYDHYVLGLHKKNVGYIESEMDVIFFMKKPLKVLKTIGRSNRAESTGNNIILLSDNNPSYTAKTRYGGMPSQIVYKIGHGWKEISKYLPYEKIRAKDVIEDVIEDVVEDEGVVENEPMEGVEDGSN